MARLNTVKSARKPTKCGRCGKTIKPGESYFWWKNRRPGAGSGVKSVRCSDHPPTMAERTPGRRGQLYGIQESVGKELDGATTLEEIQSVAESAAEEIRGLSEELTEGADNMEEGFGHSTYQSDELREKGEALEEVASDLESMDFPDAEDAEFDEDEAAAEVRLEMEAEGVDADEGDFQQRLQNKRDEFEEQGPSEEQLQTWRDHVTEKLEEAEV